MMTKNRQGLQLKILVRKRSERLAKHTNEIINPSVNELNKIASELMTTYDETMKADIGSEPTFYCSDDEDFEQEEQPNHDKFGFNKWSGLLLLDENSLLDLFASLNISTHGQTSFSTVYDKVYEIGCDTRNPYWELLNSLNELLENPNIATHFRLVMSNRNLAESLTRSFQNKSQA